MNRLMDDDNTCSRIKRMAFQNLFMKIVYYVTPVVHESECLCNIFILAFIDESEYLMNEFKEKCFCEILTHNYFEKILYLIINTNYCFRQCFQFFVQFKKNMKIENHFITVETFVYWTSFTKLVAIFNVLNESKVLLMHLSFII